ncbi:MAG: hypothetical protein IKB73_02525 [Ruminococcus sp.]|nr:hypothetical protein [Ruminococcus sp.]
MLGILGSIFDFNRDGTIDICEQAAEFMFLDSMENDDNDDCYFFDEDNYDVDFDYGF